MTNETSNVLRVGHHVGRTSHYQQITVSILAVILTSTFSLHVVADGRGLFIISSLSSDN